MNFCINIKQNLHKVEQMYYLQITDLQNLLTFTYFYVIGDP